MLCSEPEALHIADSRMLGIDDIDILGATGRPGEGACDLGKHKSHHSIRG